MNKTFRLHRQHDMDLIALYRSKDFNFTKELKKILIAYANNYPYTPPLFKDTFAEGYVGCSITFHISLSPAKVEEKKVLDLLSDIRYGYGNSFVKALFRSYMPILPLSAFSKDNGLITSRNIFAPRTKTDNKEEFVAVEKTKENTIAEKLMVTEPVVTEPITEKAEEVKFTITKESLVEPVMNVTKTTSETISSETTGFDMSSFMAGLGNLAHSH